MTSLEPDTSTQTGSEKRASAARHYLAILRRRRIAVGICLLIPLILMIILTSRKTAQYQASTDVLLRRTNLANALTGTPDPTSYAQDFIRIVQTQANIATSPQVARRVSRAIGTRTPDEVLASEAVAPQRDADILTFAATDHDPKTAVRLANLLAEQYIQYRLLLDTQSLSKAQSEVNARLAELQAKNDPSNSSLIRSLVDKQQQLGTLETLQTSNAAVIRSADAAAQTAPRWKRAVALGLLGGILLAIAVAAALESLDTRVRTESEVEERLGLQPLARIGPPSRKLQGRLLMHETPNAAEAEVFRVLRATLQFAALGGSFKSLLVTSSVPGEGKSTTVSNLALALARGGDRVILVDLDLRRPSLRRLFGLQQGPGLTDVLLDRVSLDDALTHVDLSGADGRDLQAGELRVLGAGVTAPNPGELIASDAIGGLIGQLKQHADIVLVDAPPALGLGDALTLSKHVDAMFVCVRLGTVTRRMLEDLNRALRATRVRTLGCVITGPLAEAANGYGYGYGSYSQVEEYPSAPTTADVSSEPESRKALSRSE